MLAFVDESGDPGLKCASGSSPYFVVALVIFDDIDEAMVADNLIRDLRSDIFRDCRTEFRFSKCAKHVRARFLSTVGASDFYYYGIVINKAKLWGRGFQYKEPFYKYASSLVFRNAKSILNDAKVVIDGSGGRGFRKQLEAYLKKMVNDPGQRCIRSVVVQKSSANNLIQLADMVAGAINRSFGDKEDAEVYRQIISHREMNVQFWPK